MAPSLKRVPRALGCWAAVTAATGPPDWLDACESTNATVLEHCCNATITKGCNLRVLRKPNGTSPNDTHAARFAIDRPWAISYEYTVPPNPSVFEVDTMIYYIWGDTDFDSYGLAPRAAWPMSTYIYNQIVPQLVLGNALAGNDAQYNPSWTVFTDWAIQAQYYWASCDKPEGRRCAPGHSRSFAQCGEAVSVSAGDVIETDIAYDPSSGAITASIGAKGATARSVVTLTRPFPNEDPPLWATWREFFEDAQNLSQSIVGPGVLNHPDFNIETHGVPPSELCEVCPFKLTKNSADGELGGPLVWWDTNEFNGTTAPDVACAQDCISQEIQLV